jgi:parvulin-like peptidyl-prolyl isomerase
LLLDEMIEVELLAREAERQGLDRAPETEAYLRQLMREELLRQLRDEQPRPEEIPEGDVRAYYESHPADFADPERRRVAVIALPTRKAAQEVLDLVAKEDARSWGEVARQRSLLPSPPKGTPEAARPPLELEGDLGLTTAAGESQGENPDVPPEVRDAVFRIDEPGGILDEPVQSGGRYYVVRLISKSPARSRTLAEAETVIRAKLVQQRLDEAEAALVEQLREQHPVHVDEAAVARIPLPASGPGRSKIEPAPVGTHGVPGSNGATPRTGSTP